MIHQPHGGREEEGISRAMEAGGIAKEAGSMRPGP